MLNTLKYIQLHPQTFNNYKRKTKLKPITGLSYQDGMYMLSRKWNHFYLTYNNNTYTINSACYQALAKGGDIYKSIGIFIFKNGFEESTEGKLLLQSTDRLLSQEEVQRCQDLFDAGLVYTYISDYLLNRSKI